MEKNVSFVFSAVEKEYLTVLWAIEKLPIYVEGSHFRVVTDHYSLLWLKKLDSPSGRLGRWSVRLQEYDIDIIHRKDKYHVCPVALSRSVPQLDTIQVSPKTIDKLGLLPRTMRGYCYIPAISDNYQIRPKFSS